MKLRLILGLGLLAVAPVVSLGWLGTRMMADDQVRISAQFARLAEGTLTDTAVAAARMVATRERELLKLTEGFPTDATAIRTLSRVQTRLADVLVFAADGRLDFPPVDGPNSAAERGFLERTRGLWHGRAFAELFRPQPSTASSGVERRDGPALPGGHGWRTWYWGGGLNLMFLRRLEDGRLLVVEFDRIRLLADLVAILPSTTDQEHASALMDANGVAIYQWGELASKGHGAPLYTVPLAAPLQAWKLGWLGPPPPVDSAGASFGLWGSLGGAALLLLLLAGWVFRESDRELRLAASRVSFVNQVSHELKTPLTNIRMYAELLEDELFDADEKTERYLRVITLESQRLSRMISNILTFARGQRTRLTLRPSPTTVDALVQEVLEEFAPSLQGKGVEVELALDAPARVLVDADAIRQVLCNLLSNVEKYGAGGRWARIETQQAAGETTIRVSDRGPGVSRGDRAQIFEPFHRASDALSEGASGTGIGLGIARDLARLHGGELRLLKTEVGACFEARFEHEEATR